MKPLLKWPANLMRTLSKGVNALSPSCKQATRLQSEAMDRQLPFLHRLGLRVHLLLCKWCRRYGKQLSFLRGAAQDCAEHDLGTPPVTLSSEARERIKRALETGKE